MGLPVDDMRGEDRTDNIEFVVLKAALESGSKRSASRFPNIPTWQFSEARRTNSNLARLMPFPYAVRHD